MRGALFIGIGESHEGRLGPRSPQQLKAGRELAVCDCGFGDVEWWTRPGLLRVGGGRECAQEEGGFAHAGCGRS